jgi:hypothetical protein
MCINFRKINREIRKDHYPLPFIDQTLERLAKHSYFCYIDGYSVFSQIFVHLEDQLKTTFTCTFGLYAYRCMPFDLCNAPATFQRCMTVIFPWYFVKNIMDDFSIYGNSFNHRVKQS